MIYFINFFVDSKLQEIIFQLLQLLHHNKLHNPNTILNHNTNHKITSNINHNNNNHTITMITIIMMMDNMIQDLMIQVSVKEMVHQLNNTINQHQLQFNNNNHKLTTINTLTNNNNNINMFHNIQQKVLTDSNHQANFP